MSELYPVDDSDDLDQMITAATKAVELHWRSYNDLPPAERLGDEGIWDILLPGILTDVGITPDKAHELCQIGKLEALLYVENTTA